jgi:hypothetical protein
MADAFGELAKVWLDNKWGVGEEGLFPELFHVRIHNQGS